MTEILDFLLTRRSRPSRLLSAPGPDRETLEILLTAATRVPDHGKLEPWRLIVLGPEARDRLATEAKAHGQSAGLPEEKIAKGVNQFNSPCVVVVVTSPRETDRIPKVEQVLSAGAVCVSLVNAALATGWGASWLTGWIAHDREFAEAAYDLAPQEEVAGLIHIGTSTATPPERPRPDLSQITQWQD